jgi:glutaredoxin-like protein NrdH
MEPDIMPRETAPVIKVYSKTPCVQCNGVKRHLTKNAADYDVVDLTIKPGDDPSDPVVQEKLADLAALKELGYTGVPVTFVNDDHFYGFDPDRLDDAIARQRRASMHLVEETAVA